MAKLQREVHGSGLETLEGRADADENQDRRQQAAADHERRRGGYPKADGPEEGQAEAVAIGESAPGQIREGPG